MSQHISWPINIIKKLLPSSIGQKVKDDSLSVTIASDQPAFNVTSSSAGAPFGKTSEVVIDETDWFLLPSAPEATRVGLGIQNYTGVPILVTLTNTLAANKGTTIEDKGERFYDIKAPVWARRKTGSGPISLIVEELYI